MKTIIIIRLGRMGDVTLTGPTIKNLRYMFPEARIIYLTREMYEPLAAMLPGVNDIISFPNDGSYLDLIKLTSAMDELQPDLVVDLHKNFRSFHLANLTKAPYKVVYKKRRKERMAAVNDKKFVSPIPHTVDQYNLVIDQLKGERLARRPDLILPEKYLSGKEANRIGVAMVPGASSEVKMWPAERFAEVAERIIGDFDLPVHIFLGEQEAYLQSYFEELPEDKRFFHVNQPIPEVAALISRCRLTITNDSGLMHVSSAVGTPTVALFGPTHEQLGFYPLGIHDVMLATDEKCRPCSLHGDEPCYREEQYCFTNLTITSIYDKIAQMLDKIDLKPAAFVDRDGTLIVDRNYLADPEKIEFIPGALDAVRGLRKAGYKIVVISNQSGVARGFFPVETVELVNRRLERMMAEAGCPPDDMRFCPYHPDGDVPEYTGENDCRKPRPGMLEEAAARLGIDVKRSYIIGDKKSDSDCGKIAGCFSILVKTGKGTEAVAELNGNAYFSPYYIADDLKSAADFILKKK